MIFDENNLEYFMECGMWKMSFKKVIGNAIFSTAHTV